MFRNSFYGDAVRELDWGVGRILSAVKRSANSRRTLVVFTSDNGAALGTYQHVCAVIKFVDRCLKYLSCKPSLSGTLQGSYCSCYSARM